MNWNATVRKCLCYRVIHRIYAIGATVKGKHCTTQVETDSPIKEKVHSRGWFRKWDVEAWAGSIWLRTGTGGGHL